MIAFLSHSPTGGCSGCFPEKVRVMVRVRVRVRVRVGVRARDGVRVRVSHVRLFRLSPCRRDNNVLTIDSARDTNL